MSSLSGDGFEPDRRGVEQAQRVDIGVFAGARTPMEARMVRHGVGHSSDRLAFADVVANLHGGVDRLIGGADSVGVVDGDRRHADDKTGESDHSLPGGEDVLAGAGS